MRSILLLLLVCLTLAACSPVYIPNAPTTVLPREPGDLHLAVSTGTHGVDGSIAIAANDQMVVVAAGSYKGGGEEFDYAHHAYGEILAGWYVPFSAGSFVLLGGGGGGKASASCTDAGFGALTCDNMIRSGNYTRYVVQANIGFGIERTTPPTVVPGTLQPPVIRMPVSYRQELGLATRVALVRFPRLAERSYTFDPVTGDPIAGMATEREVTAIFFEPTLFTRWVSGPIGFEGQIGATIPVAGRGTLPIQYLNVSVGIFLRLE